MERHVCLLCKEEFSKTNNLNRHLSLNRCKANMLEIHEKIKNLSQTVKTLNEKCTSLTLDIKGNHNTVKDSNNIININININDINSLDTSYIGSERMEKIVNTFDESNIKLLVGDFIRDILANKNHPENHVVKYIRKKPATFSTLTKDKDGNLINIVKDLGDTLLIIKDPVLEVLRSKINEYLRDYKNTPEYNRYKAKELLEELRKEQI